MTLEATIGMVLSSRVPSKPTSTPTPGPITSDGRIIGSAPTMGTHSAPQLPLDDEWASFNQPWSWSWEATRTMRPAAAYTIPYVEPWNLQFVPLHRGVNCGIVAGVCAEVLCNVPLRGFEM